MYGHLKVDTAEIAVQALSPIRNEADRMMKDLPALDKILKQGADRAREKASRTIARVYDRVGFLPGRPTR